MTDPRLAWLLAQLDADEKAAKAASEFGDNWELQTSSLFKGAPRAIHCRDGRVLEWGHLREATPSDAEARHIVTWDPARALAVVAALRQVLEVHAPFYSYEGVLVGCSNCEDGKQQLVDWPCSTVRAIASIFADRPGFAEVWGDE